MFVLVFLFFAGIFLTVSLVSAINLKVEKISSSEAWVSDLDKPVVFDLKITNLGSSDSFSFYNLLGFRMFPVGTVHFNAGETCNVELGVSPIGTLDSRGFYSFEYYGLDWKNPKNPSLAVVPPSSPPPSGVISS